MKTTLKLMLFCYVYTYHNFDHVKSVRVYNRIVCPEISFENVCTRHWKWIEGYTLLQI